MGIPAHIEAVTMDTRNNKPTINADIGLQGTFGGTLYSDKSNNQNAVLTKPKKIRLLSVVTVSGIPTSKHIQNPVIPQTYYESVLKNYIPKTDARPPSPSTVLYAIQSPRNNKQNNYSPLITRASPSPKNVKNSKISPFEQMPQSFVNMRVEDYLEQQ